MIASESQLNLGLFHYYFDGKIEIGMTAYDDIRITFDHYVADYNLAQNEVDIFIFSSAIELYLLFSLIHLPFFHRKRVLVSLQTPSFIFRITIYAQKYNLF